MDDLRTIVEDLTRKVLIAVDAELAGAERLLAIIDPAAVGSITLNLAGYALGAAATHYLRTIVRESPCEPLPAKHAIAIALFAARAADAKAVRADLAALRRMGRIA